MGKTSNYINQLLQDLDTIKQLATAKDLTTFKNFLLRAIKWKAQSFYELHLAPKNPLFCTCDTGPRTNNNAFTFKDILILIFCIITICLVCGICIIILTCECLARKRKIRFSAVHQTINPIIKGSQSSISRSDNNSLYSQCSCHTNEPPEQDKESIHLHFLPPGNRA